MATPGNFDSLTVNGDSTLNGQLSVAGKAIWLGLQGNGGGRLAIVNNTNDNKLFLEAFDTKTNASAKELLLTGANGGAVPKLSLTAETTVISGKLGVGTATPSTLFHVWGRLSIGGHSDTNSIDGSITFFASDPNSPWYHIQSTGGRLHFSHGGRPGDHELMSIGADGNVQVSGSLQCSGIACPNMWSDPANTSLYFRSTKGPNHSITIIGETGDVLFRDPATGAINTVINGSAGNVQVTGDVILQNADCAEDFEVVTAVGVEPGTVMVLNDDGQLEQGTKPYDKRVAGVVSGAGDLKPGLVLGRQPGQTDRLPIALIGKVYCKVDTACGPIEVGDLLTTSATPGHAMKASDPTRAFGTVIGKALQPLASGQGLVRILVALQ